LPADTGIAYEIDASGVPGETWKQAVVLVNPDNANPLSVALPAGDWQTAFDGNGPATAPALTGTATVPAKAGLILFKQ